MFKHANNIFEIAGAIHLHTQYSDGSVDYPELKETASKVGLDYIVVTDHMTLRAKNEGLEGVFDNLITVIGYEHNDQNEKNHYLAVGCREVASEHQDVQLYINQIKESGGVGFLAHPDEKRNYFRRYPSYPWTEWEVSGFDGIELWNQMSEWVESLRSWISFFRIFYPRRFLKGVPDSLMKKWDRLNLTRFVSGIGGVDAHTYNLKIFGFTLKIFPLKVELKGIRTYLYLQKDPFELSDEEAMEQVKTALAKGHGFIGYYRRGDARGTLITLIDNNNREFFSGEINEEVELPAKISVKIPSFATISLIRNGDTISTIKSTNALFEIDKKGVYRIEVYKREDAWIYSNPFPIGEYPIEK